MRARITLALVVWIAAGCGLQPVPRVAVEGTTIAIAAPEAFDVGFGRVLNELDPPTLAEVTASMSTIEGPPINPSQLDYEDLQRGEMIALLVENGTPIALLPVRYVAGVNADPATDTIRHGPDRWARQHILLVDIPKTRANGLALVTLQDKFKVFSIELRRYRRRSFDSTSFDLVPQTVVPTPPTTEWVGWAANFSSTDPADGIKITVVDSPTALNTADNRTMPTGFTASDLGGTFEVDSASIVVEDGIPDPHFAVQLDALAGPYGAFEFDIEYPAERMELTGIRPNRGSGWVAITPSSTGPTMCTPELRTARIHAADSEADISGVIVNFEIKSSVVGCGSLEPVDVASEVVLTSTTLKAFDLDGSALPAPSFWISEKGL